MPHIVWALWLFAVGACVGSFLNVCIYRLPAGLSIVRPPSHCMKCQKCIAWYDNLPVLSYVVLRGRCRHCGAEFSPQYVVVEILTGLVFAGYYVAYFVFLVRGTQFARWDIYLAYMALAGALIVSSAIDFKYKEIYTAVTNGGMAAAVLLCAAFPAIQMQSHGPQWFPWERLNAVASSVTGLLLGAGMIWITRILGRLAFRREAMGFGDVLLMGMIGAVLGWEGAVLTFFIAPFFGLLFGVWQLMQRREHEVPYGPFLSMGAGVVMLVQPAIVAWFGPGVSAIWQRLSGG